MLSPERILQTSLGFHASRTLLAAIELRLFTELGKGPRSANQLCHALQLSQRAVPGWLDALVALGFVNRDDSGEPVLYLNTRETSHFLDRNSSAYLGARLEGLGRGIYVDWDALIDSLRKGDNLPEWVPPPVQS
jgi:DNA-binding transcriptional ArsR family regulator